MIFPIPKTFTIQEIEDKLQKLREEWKTNIPRRPVIERQATLLKRALEMKKNRQSGLFSHEEP